MTDSTIPAKKPAPNTKAYKKYCATVAQVYNSVVSGQADILTKFPPQDLCNLQFTNVNFYPQKFRGLIFS